MDPRAKAVADSTDAVASTAMVGTAATIAESNRTQPHDAHDSKTTDDLTELAKLNVAPFLAKHQPRQYAPLRSEDGTPAIPRLVNDGYCYRHQPDSKCRRQADEQSMRELQQVSRSGIFFNMIRLTVFSRTWKPSLKVTSKALPTSGPYSPLRQPSSAS